MKKQILLIEDSFEIRDNLAEILELSGYEVLQAEDGKVGVEMAQQHLPDLILCDIMMPKLDGYGVLHILSKSHDTMRIPFIFLTAKAEKTDVRKGMSLGADDYIVKPFDETDLLEAVANRLRKHEIYESGGQVATQKASLEDVFQNKVHKSYNKKDIIYREGDSSTAIFKLLKGKVKLLRISTDGKEMVLDLVREGEYFGYWSVLQHSDYEETAEALDDTEVEMVQAADFRHVIESEVGVAHEFIKMLSSNLLAKEYKIVELAYNSVRKRVASALIELCDKYNKETDKPFSISVSRETLAGIAGTTVESAIRMLSDFKSSNLIKVNKAEITILDYNKLKNTPF
jgi:DNA-binding response OmpR family regulator